MVNKKIMASTGWRAPPRPSAARPHTRILLFDGSGGRDDRALTRVVPPAIAHAAACGLPHKIWGN